ncbi:MAG: serine/threonine-protein phosphatase, partial [Chloroflexi bacterium]|nr:serine/threonine-protein phosphatase [Chloroflexota bacterium]
GAALIDFAACRLWPADTPPEAMAEDVANDLRALAAELHFLLTGSRSFDAETTRRVVSTETVVGFFARALPPGPGFATAAEMIGALDELRGPEPPKGINIDLCVGRATHVGQVRTLNEDSLMVMESVRMHESTARPFGLFVVADGMGGQQSGEVASRIALDAIARRAQVDLFSAVGGGAPGATAARSAAWITTAAEAAHRAVAERREAAHSDMGSTLVMALVDGVAATVTSIGDSRAYLVEASGEIVQLTTDDSLVQRLVDSNQITADEARQHPKRSVILRALGAGAFQPPDVITRELFLGDRLVLCSDGLSSMLDDLMMAQIVTGSASPQEACARLIEAANASGGEDNVSVIVVEVVPV